jgi:hypothetical protein
MESHRKSRLWLLPLAGTVVLLCISCQDKTAISDRVQAGAATIDKCVIDLANPQDCTLSKFLDERAVWLNNSGTAVFVCANPDNDPFEAYGWQVPANGGKRKTGSIMSSVSPGGEYTFYTSDKFCTWPQPSEGRRSNPKIIIGSR